MAIDLMNYAPPRCAKHGIQMLLYFYARPGSPDGNHWGCPTCVEERTEASVPPTRWPNAGEPEGAEL